MRRARRGRGETTNENNASVRSPYRLNLVALGVTFAVCLVSMILLLTLVVLTVGTDVSSLGVRLVSYGLWLTVSAIAGVAYPLVHGRLSGPCCGKTGALGSGLACCGIVFALFLVSDSQGGLYGICSLIEKLILMGGVSSFCGMVGAWWLRQRS